MFLDTINLLSPSSKGRIATGQGICHRHYLTFLEDPHFGANLFSPSGFTRALHSSISFGIHTHLYYLPKSNYLEPVKPVYEFCLCLKHTVHMYIFSLSLNI